MGFRKIISIILSISVVTGKIPVISAAETIPEGWLIWHSYTSYSEMDSQLYLRDNEGKIKEITGDFVNPMNGSFGITPDKAVFMAIDKNFDEWDIYLYDNSEKTVSNLTENSGFRNEDPKWMPDGKSIVFKRGYWNNTVSDFTYNLAILNLQNMEIKMLTDDSAEEAMPYISDDGNFLAGFLMFINIHPDTILTSGKIIRIYFQCLRVGTSASIYHLIISLNASSSISQSGFLSSSIDSASSL